MYHAQPEGMFFIIILKGLLIAKSINDQSDNRRNLVNGVKLISQQSFDRVNNKDWEMWV